MKIEYDIEGLYGYGWEMVTSEDDFLEAKARLKEYRENEPGTAFRINRVRVKEESQ